MSTVVDRPQTRPVTEEEVLRNLQALVPTLLERAPEAERLRRLPQATIDDMKASGYLSAFRTRYWGGPGLGLSALANGARIMAQGCASTAWTITFLAQHTWMFAKANLELQKELLGTEFGGFQAGTLARVGKLVPAEGGYRVTARTDWNSGIMHSDWVNCKALIEGDNRLMMVVMPVKDVKIEDVWHISGLRGTGSNVMVADDVFVPAHRVQPSQEFQGTTAHPVHDGEPFASYPFLPVVYCTVSAVALGTAEAAVEEFRRMLLDRTLAFSGGQKQLEQPLAQMRLGEAIGQLRTVQMLWHAMVKLVIDTCEPRGQLTPTQRVGIRIAATQVVHGVRRLLDDTIMPNCGGGMYYETAPLQRRQRDIEVLKGHAMFDWDRGFQLLGKTELGIEPAPTDLF